MESRVLLFNIHRISYDLIDMEVEPHGLLALAAFLETKGYDSLIFQGEPAAARDYLERQVCENPIAAVGFYCDFENQVEVCQMSQEIAGTHGIPVVLGGPQVGGFDRDYLRDSGCLVAVHGEGEITLWRLLDCLCRQTGDWRELDGIAYVNDEGVLVRNPDRPALSNLDDLPLPALHRWVNKPIRTTTDIMTGRGCPFNCAFCHEGSLSRKMRLRSVDHVMREVRTILDSEPDIKYIAFVDDTFVIAPERTRAFCEALSHIREERDFVWYCEAHVKLLSRRPDMLADMAKAGLVRMQIGIESGVQKVLDAYNKKITIEEIKQVIGAGVDAGIHQIIGCFIVGGAFESPEIVERNRAFCEELLGLAAGVLDLSPSPLIPYPNTDIARCPEKYALRLLDPQGATTMSDYPVTETAAMPREEIARAQNELMFHGLKTMVRLFREGRVPHERILNCFRDLSYGVVSLWYTAIYSKTPFVEGYYRLLARKAASRSAEIPPAEIDGWRPQRVMELWAAVNFDEGFPKIGEHVLSPLEFELLIYSTGKLRLREALDAVYAKFSERFESRAEFDAEARRILKTFEDRYWLVYAPL